MPKGATFTDRRVSFADERTGAEIVQLTAAPSIHHTLYFTNPSVTADGRWAIFVSDRAGGWNLFAADLDGRDLVQLTDTGDINPFSAAPDRVAARIYFTAGGQVRALDIETLSETVLADFGDVTLGGCHLSADGARLVTVVRWPGSNALASVRTDGSWADVFFEPPREVGYAQICPVDDSCVLYSSGIRQRMWTVTMRGWRDRPLYLHDARQWITHESWLGASDTVLFTKWPDGLMAIKRNGEGLRAIARMTAWHASSRADGSLIVADTAHPDVGLQLIDPMTGRTATLCHSEASSQGTRWKYRTPEPGVVTDSTYGPQWTHPHPAFSPDGRRVAFTSDRSGHPQVYLVRVPDVIEWNDGGSGPS